jgi:hypothetical protein
VAGMKKTLDSVFFIPEVFVSQAKINPLLCRGRADLQI